jgi:hypothetical protein
MVDSLAATKESAGTNTSPSKAVSAALKSGDASSSALDAEVCLVHNPRIDNPQVVKASVEPSEAAVNKSIESKRLRKTVRLTHKHFIRFAETRIAACGED